VIQILISIRLKFRTPSKLQGSLSRGFFVFYSLPRLRDNTVNCQDTTVPFTAFSNYFSGNSSSTPTNIIVTHKNNLYIPLTGFPLHGNCITSYRDKILKRSKTKLRISIARRNYSKYKSLVNKMRTVSVDIKFYFNIIIIIIIIK